eukprot:238029-Chlamydomonas_euryale.AAC.5
MRASHRKMIEDCARQAYSHTLHLLVAARYLSAFLVVLVGVLFPFVCLDLAAHALATRLECECVLAPQRRAVAVAALKQCVQPGVPSAGLMQQAGNSAARRGIIASRTRARMCHLVAAGPETAAAVKGLHLLARLGACVEVQHQGVLEALA